VHRSWHWRAHLPPEGERAAQGLSPSPLRFYFVCLKCCPHWTWTPGIKWSSCLGLLNSWGSKCAARPPTPLMLTRDGQLLRCWWCLLDIWQLVEGLHHQCVPKDSVDTRMGQFFKCRTGSYTACRYHVLVASSLKFYYPSSPVTVTTIDNK
jgi:hypothetical protein